MSVGDAEARQRVLVPFHGDHIVCARDDARTFRVALNPTCEAMGLEYSGQLQRLRRQPWATMGVMPMVAEDGKVRDFVTIDRRTFAMWLATIEASRLKDEAVRAKIATYQSEAADVLDRHFFGEPTVPYAPVEDPRIAAARQLLSVIERQVDQEKRLAAVEMESAVALETANEAIALASGATGYVALRGFCRKQGLRKTGEEIKRMGQALSRLARSAGVELRKVDDEEWGEINKYPTAFLEEHADYIRGFRLKSA